MYISMVRGGGQISLQELALKATTKGILNGQLLTKNTKGQPESLNPKQVILPHLMSEKVFDLCIKYGTEMDAKMFNRIILAAFKDSSKMPLQKICIQNAVCIKASTLTILLKANPWVTELDIRGCQLELTKDLINSCLKLKTLKINKLYGKLKCPSLKALVVQQWKVEKGFRNFLMPRLLDNYLEPVIRNLTYLDLSGCDGVKSFTTLTHALKLETLILHDNESAELIDDILKLKHLRTLDISVSPNSRCSGVYNDPDFILTRITESLPNLTHLDISGTNLAGYHNLIDDTGNVLCGIPGLAKRLQKPLEFLGVFLTHQNGASRTLIPAFKIAGENNENQLLTALERNLNRPQMTFCILRKLWNINTEILQLFEVERRGKLFCQLVKSTLSPMCPMPQSIIYLAMKFLLGQMLETEFKPSLKLTREIIASIFISVEKSNSSFKIIEAAYDLLVKFEILKDIEFDFKTFADIVMQIDTSQLSLEKLAKVWQLRALIVNKTNFEKSEFLCELQIVEKSLEFVQRLHFGWQSMNIRSDLLPFVELKLVWQTLIKVLKGNQMGIRRFIWSSESGVSGLKWLLWYQNLSWRSQSRQLFNILKEIAIEIEKYPELLERPFDLKAISRRKEKQMAKSNKKCFERVKKWIINVDNSSSVTQNVSSDYRSKKAQDQNEKTRHTRNKFPSKIVSTMAGIIISLP